MMKTRLFFLLVGLFLTLTAQAHGEHPAQHGGQVIEAGDDVLEWVAQENAFYLSDHDGKDISTAGASGKLIAVGGGTKTTAALTPAGGNRLNLSALLPTGNDVKAVISITLPGHAPIQARLEGLK